MANKEFEQVTPYFCIVHVIESGGVFVESACDLRGWTSKIVVGFGR